ncbi:major facilitator superfamily domain-containing protein [Aspergillus bertholletiae]|uniref:Major facilitator superfamily domain-containing protein n=1 Tax=Aspergillus bertholletiae TaxID=1226010 RepID=A0A5N7B4M0_9EURO|nr:major facilitator superfamily domain-containing protein [Aspergillus bertholletiae]
MDQTKDTKAPEVASVTVYPKNISRDPSSPLEDSLEAQQSSPPVYHIFTRSRKLEMVMIVSIAAIFSPLSSNIYFPALGAISRDLHTSMALTTLTITIYMIVQGIAPTFWGSISDSSGRRPVFIGTMIVYIVANIALGVSTNYGELMAFRALQAAGSAATISIGAGVIGDITTSAERGSLVGIFGGVRMLGQGVGPVFGGLLAQYLGFRSIFWFLTICAGASLLIILVLLPETLRSIAGNGTVPLHGLQKPWLYYITGQPDTEEGAEPDLKKSTITLRTVFAPLRFLREIDVFITLFFGSIVYTVWSMVTSSTSDLFEQTYNLSTLEVGLTFLGNGFGCMSGSYTIGYLMDYNHRVTEREYCERHNYPPGTRVNLKTHPDFPIETARMRNTWWITILFIVCVAVYGVSLRTHLAVPIILQYIIAYCSTGIFTINSALVIDLYPGASASATAVNNLMRCLIGAAGVAAAQPMIDALGPVYTFVLLAGITLVLFPLLWVETKYGPGWRLARHRRLNGPRASYGE